MSSKIRGVISFAVSLLSLASAGEGGGGGEATLNLSEFQRVLRTGLDNELSKIEDGSKATKAKIEQEILNIERNVHNKRRSNMRRRATSEGSIEQQELSSSKSFPTDKVWDDLMEHSWQTARTIKRDDHGGLRVTTDPEEAQPIPFLVCERGRKQQQEHSDDGEDNSVWHIIALFEKQYSESLLVSSSNDETCLILTLSALDADEVVEEYEETSMSLVVVPLLDITKIHAGTVDEVSSQGWSVPFHEQVDEIDVHNSTEALNHWERMIVVDFVPGLGGMHEEAELLDVVNNMMGDIQDMGEVGWLRSLETEEAEEFLVDESLVGVPALSDMFSLTTSLRTIDENDEADNARLTFWRDALKNGIESEHACNDMFSTLFVKPRSGYYGYDLGKINCALLVSIY